MIFGFTGTRKGMTIMQKAMFRTMLTLWNGDKFHHGDCLGADQQAGDLAKIHGCFIEIHPPSDPKFRARCKGDIIHPEKPYLYRDKDIVNACDFMVGTPRGMKEELRSGTWATIRYAKKINKRLTIIYPDGSVEHFNDVIPTF